MKEPGLRVEARAIRRVRDLDLTTWKAREELDGARFCDAPIRRRQQSEGGAFAARERMERITQRTHAADRDERDDRVDAIGGGDLPRELVADRRLIRSTREQRRGRERSRGSLRFATSVEREKSLGWPLGLVVDEERGGLRIHERLDVPQDLRDDESCSLRAILGG